MLKRNLEKKHVVMLEGLDIEIALWRTFVVFLDGPGWTTALMEAEK